MTDRYFYPQIDVLCSVLLQDREIVSCVFFLLLSQLPYAVGGSCLQRRPSVFLCLAQGCWFRSTSHSSDTSCIVSCSQLLLCICSSRPAGFCERLSHWAALQMCSSDSFSQGEKSANIKQCISAKFQCVPCSCVYTWNYFTLDFVELDYCLS